MVGYICDFIELKNLLFELKKGFIGKFLVDVDNGFIFYYVVSDVKKKIVVDLKWVLKDVDEFYLVMDEDCEGEVIVWYLFEVLKLKVFVKWMVFYEIMKEVI